MAQNVYGGLGIDFVPGLQSGIISDRGAKMVHEMGLACPRCRTNDTHAGLIKDGKLNARSPNCPNCNGDGMLYRNPELLTGLAVSIRQATKITDLGVTQPGDMQFSPGAADNCGATTRMFSKEDKFTATWPQALDEGQTIVRGAAHMSDNPRLSNNVEENEDRLWYEPAKALWCEDENGVSYSAEGDFTLGPGRVIKWAGNSPAVGTKYVIKYTAYFEWIAFIPPMDRFDRDNADLGPLIFLRRKHAVFINETPHISDDDRIPLSARISC